MVVRGEVLIDDVTVLIDQPEVKVWIVELGSKYAQVLGYSTEEVLLVAGDRTPTIDQALRGRPTAVVVNLPEPWQIIAESARYTCRIVAYRPPDVAGD